MKMSDKIDEYMVGDFVYKKSSTLGPRIQTGVQVMYVYSGSARITIDGRERMLESGEMTLLMPRHVELFEFSPTGKTHHGWCTAMAHDPSAFSAFSGTDWAFVLKMPPLIRPLTDRGIELRHKKTLSAQALYKQIAETIFYEYFHAAGFPAHRDVPLPEPVLKACEWMELNYESPCVLDDIARAAGVTGAHLIRLFKEHLRETPMRRLWSVRCDTGRRLLVETGLSVAEVAWQCGYKTPYL